MQGRLLGSIVVWACMTLALLGCQDSKTPSILDSAVEVPASPETPLEKTLPEEMASVCTEAIAEKNSLRRYSSPVPENGFPLINKGLSFELQATGVRQYFETAVNEKRYDFLSHIGPDRDPCDIRWDGKPELRNTFQSDGLDLRCPFDTTWIEDANGKALWLSIDTYGWQLANPSFQKSIPSFFGFAETPEHTGVDLRLSHAVFEVELYSEFQQRHTLEGIRASGEYRTSLGIAYTGGDGSSQLIEINLNSAATASFPSSDSWSENTQTLVRSIGGSQPQTLTILGGAHWDLQIDEGIWTQVRVDFPLLLRKLLLDGVVSTEVVSNAKFKGFYVAIATQGKATRAVLGVRHFRLTEHRGESRFGETAFDSDYYLSSYRDLDGSLTGFHADRNKAALLHWLEHGLEEGRSPSVGILLDFYLYANRDFPQSYDESFKLVFEHWLAVGLRQGRLATPAFDFKFYLENNQSLKEQIGEDPQAAFYHWIDEGLAQGLSASPAFDPKHYLEANPELKLQFGQDYKAVLIHWLTQGIEAGLEASALFDVGFYRNSNRVELELSGNDTNRLALYHWLVVGIPTGRPSVSGWDPSVQIRQTKSACNFYNLLVEQSL